AAALPGLGAASAVIVVGRQRVLRAIVAGLCQLIIAGLCQLIIAGLCQLIIADRPRVRCSLGPRPVLACVTASPEHSARSLRSLCCCGYVLARGIGCRAR